MNRLLSRSMKHLLSLAVVLLLSVPLCAAAKTIPVTDTGNTDDVTGFGGVSNSYRIGAYEVTNDEYADFLNAKARTETVGLYHANMGRDPRGGIERSGENGSFTYTVKPNMGNKPVNFVNWYDALRFANWLNNGGGNGDTETGSYTLLGNTTPPTNGTSISRNAGTRWFLPSEDEWYKAAYYDPRTTAQGGPPGNDHYWQFPTSSDTAPAFATADVVGDIGNPGPNVANYRLAADWNGLDGNVTSVGSAGPLSASFYGTFDQGGNVWEWTEAPSQTFGAEYRILRGSSFGRSVEELASSFRGELSALSHGVNIGFRIATVVPEPTSCYLLIGAIAVAMTYCHRRM